MYPHRLLLCGRNANMHIEEDSITIKRLSLWSLLKNLIISYNISKHMIRIHERLNKHHDETSVQLMVIFIRFWCIFRKYMKRATTDDKTQVKHHIDRDRTRTCNPQIRSLVPYPLGHMVWPWYSKICPQPVGFEPTLPEGNWFRVSRLNRSATTAARWCLSAKSSLYRSNFSICTAEASTTQCQRFQIFFSYLNKFYLQISSIAGFHFNSLVHCTMWKYSKVHVLHNMR